MASDRPEFARRIEMARATVAAMQQSREEHPLWETDQLDAASRDARQILDGLHAYPEKLHIGLGEYGEASALVLAAITGCRECPHIARSGYQPIFTRLRSRTSDCGRCWNATPDRPPAESGSCHWCDTQGNEHLTPLAVTRGPVIAIGDACGRCALILRCG